METGEKRLIEMAAKESPVIRQLYERHIFLDQKISAISDKPFLTPTEEVEYKKLKKEKLYGKDRLMALVSRYRREEASPAGCR